MEDGVLNEDAYLTHVLAKLEAALANLPDDDFRHSIEVSVRRIKSQLTLAEWSTVIA
jgi:hypothetical protein